MSSLADNAQIVSLRALFRCGTVALLLALGPRIVAAQELGVKIAEAAPPSDAQRIELARSLFQRGTEASKLGHWLEARAAFKRSLEHVVKPSTLFNLAIADIQLGQGDEALQALDTFSLLANPTEHADMIGRVRLLRSLATSLSAQRRPTALAETALMDVPGLAEAANDAFAEATECYVAGDLTRAQEAFARAYELSHRPELLFDIGLAADRRGAEEQALIAYKAFVAALPDTPQAATARARVLLLGGALSSAPVTPMVSAPPAAAPAPQPAARLHTVVAPAPSDRRPVIAAVLGGGLAAAAVGSGIWWVDRAHELDRCPASGDDKACTSESRQTVTRQYRAAIATTLSLLALSIPLVTWGAVRWAQRGRVATPPRLGIAFGASGAHASARFHY